MNMKTLNSKLTNDSSTLFKNLFVSNHKGEYMNTNTFDKQLKIFVRDINKMVKRGLAASYRTINYTVGRRYIKLVMVEGTISGITWGFIDRHNGDILRPKNNRQVAKNGVARGNIFDEFKGLANVTEYGPNYMSQLR